MLFDELRAFLASSSVEEREPSERKGYGVPLRPASHRFKRLLGKLQPQGAPKEEWATLEALVFHDILDRLELPDVKSVRLVCTAWRDMADYHLQSLRPSKFQGFEVRAAKLFPNLKHLELKHGNQDNFNLSQLSHLKGLRSLKITTPTHYSGQRRHWKRAVRALTDLDHLHLQNCTSFAADVLLHLASPQKLTALELSRSATSDSGLVTLADHCTNLRHLEVSWSSFEKCPLHYITPLVQLTHLSLANAQCTFPAIIQTTDAYEEGLTKFKALRELDLANFTWMSDQLLLDVGKLTALRSLNLCARNLMHASPETLVAQPRSCSALSRLTNLEALDFSYNMDVLDSDLTFLASLSRLRTLNMCSTSMDVVAARAIGGLPRLASINMQRCPLLRDAALLEIGAHCRCLTRAQVGDSPQLTVPAILRFYMRQRLRQVAPKAAKRNRNETGCFHPFRAMRGGAGRARKAHPLPPPRLHPPPSPSLRTVSSVPISLSSPLSDQTGQSAPLPPEDNTAELTPGMSAELSSLQLPMHAQALQEMLATQGHSSPRVAGPSGSDAATNRSPRSRPLADNAVGVVHARCVQPGAVADDYGNQHVYDTSGQRNVPIGASGVALQLRDVTCAEQLAVLRCCNASQLSLQNDADDDSRRACEGALQRGSWGLKHKAGVVDLGDVGLQPSSALETQQLPKKLRFAESPKAARAVEGRFAAGTGNDLCGWVAPPGPDRDAPQIYQDIPNISCTNVTAGEHPLQHPDKQPAPLHDNVEHHVHAAYLRDAMALACDAGGPPNVQYYWPDVSALQVDAGDKREAFIRAGPSGRGETSTSEIEFASMPTADAHLATAAAGDDDRKLPRSISHNASTTGRAVSQLLPPGNVVDGVCNAPDPQVMEPPQDECNTPGTAARSGQVTQSLSGLARAYNLPPLWTDIEGTRKAFCSAQARSETDDVILQMEDDDVAGSDSEAAVGRKFDSTSCVWETFQFVKAYPFEAVIMGAVFTLWLLMLPAFILMSPVMSLLLIFCVVLFLPLRLGLAFMRRER